MMAFEYYNPVDPRMQGPFAWPFKVLHDLFSNPPFVADPEFTSFDIDALRCKWTQKSSRSLDTPKSIFLNIDSAQLTFGVVRRTDSGSVRFDYRKLNFDHRTLISWDEESRWITGF
jgi:hypothetical protein